MSAVVPKQKFFRSPLKWPGGKFRDLGRLMPLFPHEIDTFIDPFVGSGTIAANIALTGIPSKMIVGDIDADLIQFLKMDHDVFDAFQKLLLGLEAARRDAALAPINEANFATMFLAICVRTLRHIDNTLRRNDVVKRIVDEERTRRIRAMEKMRERGGQAEANYPRTAIYAVIYYLVRDAFNDVSRNTSDPAVRVASWFVLRELAHGGVMRYSRDDRFNTAYGGMSYNIKSLLGKLPAIEKMNELFKSLKTEIRHEDFLSLLHYADPGPNDFVFFDPPYERAFRPDETGNGKATLLNAPFYPYVRNAENISSHSDLFRWLQAHGDKTRWMLVERQTPWIMEKIEELEKTDPRIKVETYERTYAANIKGRNNRSTTHIIVTNYRR